MDTDKDLESLILQFFHINAIQFGEFELKSGSRSPFYLDIREIISFPSVMELLINLLIKKMMAEEIDGYTHICGVPYSGLPIATLLSSKLHKSMLIRRKEVKDYGTRKVIEGKYNSGDICTIIEDVVTSGSSVLETVQDLELANLQVSDVIIVLDREQGGVRAIEEKGIKAHTLTSISTVLDILEKHNKISEDILIDVRAYISEHLYAIKKPEEKTVSRLTMSFSERAKLTKNRLTVRLMEIMEKKKSNLCFAADLTSSTEFLKLVSKLGPYICLLKTHIDLLDKVDSYLFAEMERLSKQHNFIIMEDRKFADIGNTVKLQFSQVKKWADIVTAHSIIGENIIKGLKESVNGDPHKGCFLVAQLSCEGNLIDSDYSRATAKMAEVHSDFVIGLVCQTPELIQRPNLLQLTPGVKILGRSDDLGQNYNSPEWAVLKNGADIVVVGRGIIDSVDPEETAAIYKERLWDAYSRRLN